MDMICQMVTVPQNKQIDVKFIAPDSTPIGEAEMYITVCPIHQQPQAARMRHLAGALARSETFAGDPIEIQRTLRNEW